MSERRRNLGQQPLAQYWVSISGNLHTARLSKETQPELHVGIEREGAGGGELYIRHPYRAGEIAFDLGLWDLPVGTDTDVLSIQFAEWGPPLWVLEAVSDTTRTADLVHKKKVCEAMDILEYWIFDREATPKLQGWHWTQAGYREILADDTGEKPSAVLQTSLREIGDLIELRDPDLGNWVPMQKQAHAEGRVAGRAEAFAELLVVYVTRYSDSRFGREFRVWLQGHAITSWPDLGSLIQIVEDTNSSSQREQTFRLLLASPTDAPGRSTEK